MNIMLRPPMTLEAFLAWEREQELRYEFDGVGPVPMNGGTIEHSVIATNLVRALEDRLVGTPCRAVRGDLKVIVDARVRYPDAMVTCSPIPRGTDIIPNPVVVFEVLSPSTAATDRVVKNGEYRNTSTIRRYVILEQARQAGMVYSWDGGAWAGRLVMGDVDLDLPEIGISIPMSAIYARIDFSED